MCGRRRLTDCGAALQVVVHSTGGVDMTVRGSMAQCRERVLGVELNATPKIKNLWAMNSPLLCNCTRPRVTIPHGQHPPGMAPDAGAWHLGWWVGRGDGRGTNVTEATRTVVCVMWYLHQSCVQAHIHDEPARRIVHSVNRTMHRYAPAQNKPSSLGAVPVGCATGRVLGGRSVDVLTDGDA